MNIFQRIALLIENYVLLFAEGFRKVKKHINKVPKKETKMEENYRPAKTLGGMRYCIIRCTTAGVFAGYIQSRTGKEVILRMSRNIYYWAGACGLSQLAKDGVKNPEQCKFTVVVDKRELTEAIEIIECTEKARLSIQGVEEWKA